MMKKLRKEGFVIGRYRVRQLMKQLNLVVTQRLASKDLSLNNFPVCTALLYDSTNFDGLSFRGFHGWLFGKSQVCHAPLLQIS